MDDSSDACEQFTNNSQPTTNRSRVAAASSSDVFLETQTELSMHTYRGGGRVNRQDMKECYRAADKIEYVLWIRHEGS